MRRLRLVLVIVVALGGAFWLAWPRLSGWYHLRAARAALDRYHNEEALAQLDDCLAVRPSSSEAHLLACRAARREGDFDRAARHLLECERLEGEPSPESTLERALLRAAAGDLDSVETYLEALAEKDPGRRPLVWEALAEGYLRVYRIRDALNCLDRWLRLQPDNPQALYLRGSVFRRVRSFAKAIPDLRRAVELDPGRRDARRWLAFCLLEVGQYDEAVKQLDVLRRQRPDDPDLLVRIARCQSKLGLKEPARKVLTEVLAKHPDHGLALRTLGQLALMEQKWPEAEDCLRRAVRVMPFDYEAQYALFQALQKQPDKKTAAQAQSRVAEDLKKRLERLGQIQSHDMSVHPHDPALHCEMGTLLLSVGHPDIGLSWLNSALRLDAHYAPAHAALAKYYAAHGDAERAEIHRREAGREEVKKK